MPAELSPMNSTCAKKPQNKQNKTKKKNCMSFNKPTAYGSILNLTQLYTLICEKMEIEFLVSHTTVNLNEGLGRPH